MKIAQNLTWLLLLILFTFPLLVSAQCQTHQHSLLLQVKNSLIFSSTWSVHLWNQTTDCCTWKGVECDINGLVIGLDLNSELISGGIKNTTSLFKLHHLKKLNLAFNDFNGTQIPSNLGNLTNLTHLNLSHAGFAGQIPIEISRLTRLVVLDLSNYPFGSTSSYLSLKLENPNLKTLVGNLTGLRELYLDGVNISSSGVEWSRAISGSLYKLQILSMSYCSLSGLIHHSLVDLHSLSEIYLERNNLSSPVPGFIANFTNLKILSMRRAGLYGSLPEEIVKIESLEILDLGWNKLQGTLPMSLGNLKNLSVIKLGGCAFTGSIPKTISELSKLVHLELSFNLFTGPIPTLYMAKNLRVLSLQGNQLQGNISSIDGKQLKNLYHLDLGRNSLGGDILHFLPILENLRELYLPNNHLEGNISSIDWKQFKNLISLDLGGNSFMGSINPSLLTLKNLTQLVLGGNHLEGNISSIDWKSLKNLFFLDLSSNSLTGEIPASLFTLPLLMTLRLSNNHFEGQLPEFRNTSLSNLRFIEISGNRLDGSIISIFQLKGLIDLDLSYNKFNGIIPFQSLRTFENVIGLDLSYNNLTLIGDSKEIPFIAQLNTLRLASCNIAVFPNLQNQFKLSDLDLSNNRISGKIPNWIWKIGGGGDLYRLNLSHNSLRGLQKPFKFPDVRFLDLSSNQLQGNIPFPPKSAAYIDFSSNNFTSIPAEIGDSLMSCRFISFSNNSLSGQIPNSICMATSLEVFFCSDNNLSGGVPKCLMTKGEQFGVLNLKGNNLNGTISDAFSEGCGLQTLQLNDNQLQGSIPKSLANCRKLEVLDVGNNQIEDNFPCWLKTVSSLRILILHSNKFYGSVDCAKINGSWLNLQIVDLAVNNFSGKLPINDLSSWKAIMVDENEAKSNFKGPWLGSHTMSGYYYNHAITLVDKGNEMKLVKILTVFAFIDLSSNKFEGSISHEIGQFKLLHGLNLSHNTLTGVIPSTVGNMKQLESLDLSMNRLSGTVPSQLANLNFLSVLNLSYNNFVGRIPTGTQIQSFLPSSFEGNVGLCGPPLNVCFNTTQHVPGNKVGHENSKFGWQFALSIGIGFGIGFVGAVAPLIFSDKVDLWYDVFVHKILSRF